MPCETGVAVDLGADPWPGTIRRDGDVLVLTPRSELPAGKHRLRLFCSREDGTVEELANWPLEIGGDASRRRGSLALEATLDAGWRFADSGLQDLPESSFQPAGSAKLSAGIGADRWRFYADAGFVHDDLLDELARQRGFSDLGTFKLSGQAGPLKVTAGDHAVDAALGESLVLGRFYRRGLSTALTRRGFGLTGFALSTRSVVGSDAGFGLGDERVDGAQVSHRLVDSESATLHVAAVYLSGDGERRAGVGEGTPADPLGSSGDAWAVAFSSQLFHERLALEGEYAESRFDPDGEGEDARRRGEAFAWGATLRSLGGRPLDWEVELRRRRVGALFRSLANPSLLSDRDTLEGASRLAWPRFEVRMELRREEDDVGGGASLPLGRADVASVSMTYDRNEPEDGGWLAPRTISFSWFQSDEKTVPGDDSPDGNAETSRQNRTVMVVLGGAAWTVSYSHDRFEDAFFEEGGLTHRFLDASASFAGKLWSLEPTFQWSRLEGLSPERTTLLARLTSRRQLVPAKLSGSLTLDLFQVTENGLERRAPSVGGELSWQILRPDASRFRMALWLRGNYTKTTEESVLLLRGGQAFLGARLSWRHLR